MHGSWPKLPTLVACGLLALSTAMPSEAVTGSCKVVSAGSAVKGSGARKKTQVTVHLRCGSKRPKLTTTGPNHREILATALTALAMNRKVDATYRGKTLTALMMR